MMENVLLPIVIVGMLFIGLPAVVLHFLTRWKSQTGISRQDEALLDELHDLARRLESRVETVERIVSAENPGWKDGRVTDLAEQRRQLR
jgi:phage shock protein B